MCAIFGVIGFEEAGLPARMGAAMAARGPDGDGLFEEPGVAIGNRRLAILDPERGAQPMFNDDHRLVISHSGEIYNHPELRAQLEARGHRFRTHTDTEVILRAFEEWGDEALERFNGMFAFALYDRCEKRLLLARDGSGQKPLYYWAEGGKLVFASEIKAILQCERVPRRPNLRAIDPFLALRYVPEPETMFEGIHTVPAGHQLEWRRGKRELRRHWRVPLVEAADKPRLGVGEWSERLEVVLDEAVDRHLRADVPCGAYLSSGVDSALLVSMMAGRVSRPLRTVSIGFGSSIDETAGAAEIARHFGTDHRELRLGPLDFTDLPRVVAQMDRPVGDALILAFDKLAKTAGEDHRVMLGGEGADELFAGYPFHKVLKLAEWYRRGVPSFLARGMVEPLLRAAPHRLLGRFFDFPAALGREGKAKALDFLSGCRRRDLARNSAALRTLWSEDERGKLYCGKCASLPREGWLPAPPAHGGFTDRMLATQWDEWLQDWALIRQEKNNMAHGVEHRAPFLDRDLIELAFRMPASIKLRGLRDKWILRRLAERHLPRAVAQRKKIPFYLPVGEFLQTRQMREWVELTLDPARVKQRGYFRPEAVAALRARVNASPREFVAAKQLLSLVILELWHTVFIDSRPDPPVARPAAAEVTASLPG